ncbi:VIT1/CCC1 transporter family protein [Dyella sp.]|jgi:VIT1/CCC1 family predicted Fe2+/Mn2+ transporter|uniref:VIT1/CCC1 transporter family protein n=1 Tax=Dyella sp. TaxID=1869338 RepID=UPI002C5DC233|nr:VIT1/CCC1 transporter family protein [Dyella sp.]HTC28190.1 VIT1/CCC1 transporter family protein [Dyella sp.]
MSPKHHHHTERHFMASDVVRDLVIGMADGLTVPFALAAGLSGAAVASRVVVVAGVAEIAAGAIAMGLGGYLAARGDADHYDAERRREVREVRELAREEENEIVQIFAQYGLTREACKPVLEHFHNDHDAWVDFMMRYELGLEKPEPSRALRSALTIGGAYIVGGLVPLMPYMLIEGLQPALRVSVMCTLMALAIFGAAKARFTGISMLRGALQTVFVGGLASAAAFLLARWISA